MERTKCYLLSLAAHKIAFRAPISWSFFPNGYTEVLLNTSSHHGMFIKRHIMSFWWFFRSGFGGLYSNAPRCPRRTRGHEFIYRHMFMQIGRTEAEVVQITPITMSLHQNPRSDTHTHTHTQRPRSRCVFRCEHDGEGESSRTLCS